MKNVPFILLSILMIQPFFGQSTTGQTAQNEAALRAIQNLNRIESLYFKYLNAQERQEAVRLLNETRGILVGISPPALPPNPPPVTTPTPPPPQQAAGNVLSDEGFQALLTAVKGELSDERKTVIIKTIGKSGRINCAQLDRLVELYSFDNYRKDLLISIADNISDPVNIGIVLKNFNSIFAKNEVADFFQNRK